MVKFVSMCKTMLSFIALTSLPNRRTSKGVAASRCFLYGEQASICPCRRLLIINLNRQTAKNTFITFTIIDTFQRMS